MQTSMPPATRAKARRISTSGSIPTTPAPSSPASSPRWPSSTLPTPPPTGATAPNSSSAWTGSIASSPQQLRPVAGLPYIVFHDAYPYLEQRYGLTPAGAISVSPDRQPGARRLSEIAARVKQVGARCIFSEPEFQPKLARLLAETTGARVGVLDPLGADIPPGPDAYFTLMQNLADNLVACLSGPARGKDR